MSDARAPSDDGGNAVTWPLRLTAGALQAVLVRWGIGVAAGSPLAGLLAPPPEPQTLPDAVLADLELARAVRIVAAPRQLVLVDPGTGDGLMLFAHDGGSLVRFDVGRLGCQLTAPHSQAAFATLVRSLADLAPATGGVSTTLASRRFLDVLDLLRELTDGAGGAPIPTDQVIAALAGRLEHPERASATLAALAEEGLIRIEADETTAPEAGLSALDWLTTEPRVRLAGLELADLEAGLSRPSAVVLLDGRPQQVVALPPTLSDPGSDTVLAFRAATPAAITAAIASLLAPPGSPPTRPVSAYPGDPGAWLDADAAPCTPDAWREDFTEWMVARGGDPAELALAAVREPGATVVVRRASAEAPMRRWTLALGPAGGGEWTMEGSRVRWRAVAPGQARQRLLEQLPSTTGPSDAAPCLLPAGALLGAAAAPATPATPPLPPPLARVAGSPDLEWLDVTALRAGEHRIEGIIVRLASGAGELWRLEPADDGDVATPTTVSELVDELTASLTVANG